VIFPIIECRLAYKTPARYERPGRGDALADPSRAGPAQLRLSTLESEPARPREAETHHALRLARGKPRRLPENLIASLKPYLATPLAVSTDLTASSPLTDAAHLEELKQLLPQGLLKDQIANRLAFGRVAPRASPHDPAPSTAAGRGRAPRWNCDGSGPPVSRSSNYPPRCPSLPAREEMCRGHQETSGAGSSPAKRARARPHQSAQDVPRSGPGRTSPDRLHPASPRPLPSRSHAASPKNSMSIGT